MIVDTDNIADTVELLLKYADPKGRNYKKLKIIQRDITERTMLGPKARKLIRLLVAKLDNIECVFVSRIGYCRNPGMMKKQCSYSERFSVCPKYSPAKPMINEVLHKEV